MNGEIKAQYLVLTKWRNLWLKLSNDTTRMRKMGGLQKQMDYVCNRAHTANLKIAALLNKYWIDADARLTSDKERELYESLKLKFGDKQ